MKRPVITLLTDFGLADHYVAAMKGVILGICPKADLVDISHEITPYSIPEAAYTLAQAWRCFPAGTVHMAVVDPGVGSSRRAIVAEVAGHRFVAPDNGLLAMVLDAAPGATVREISAARYFRQPVSHTFHGRDVFAPVVARLAAGLSASALGKLITDLAPGHFAKPTQIGPKQWAGTVLKIDRFGNVVTNLAFESFSCLATAPFRLKIGRKSVTSYYSTYAAAPAGQLFALKGSSGYVEVSLNQLDAASELGATPGAPIKLLLSLPISTMAGTSTAQPPK